MSYWLFAYRNSILKAHQREDAISKVIILTDTVKYALLQKYPNNALLVAKSIDLWKTAYESKFHKDVPKELIERAYALVLRFPSDEDVLFEFFEMLEKSSEASNWLKYTKNKAVVCGLIQHGMTEHLIPQ